MNPDENSHQHINNSNGNPPVGVDVDPVDNEIVELPPHLSTRMWDSFKTYMLYPFMIAVAGSFGLSIGYALYDRAAAASTNISFNFINLSALKQRLRWK
jgi:hypothetical protein